MRILVLGMCRTGTTSISVALRKLGYTPHQMRDVLVRPKDLALWQEAIDLTLTPPSNRPTKRKDQAPYSKPEFDKLLGDYDVVMDLPGCIFAKELIQAYPSAKVILTTRNYGTWESSMQESIWCLDTWNLFILCRKLNLTQLAPLMRLVHSVFRVHSGNHYGGPIARSSYDTHNETLRELVPRERLLELDTDADMNWEPLCRFLAHEVPKEPFPRLTEDRAMRKNLESAWRGMVQYLILMILLPGSVVVAGLFLYVYADAVRAFRDERVITPLKTYLDA
jgi:hypothetical protein